MAQISVKIPDVEFVEMEHNVHSLGVSKNQFVNDAIREYNLRLRTRNYAEKMKRDSLRTREALKSEIADLDGFVGDQSL